MLPNILQCLQLSYIRGWQTFSEKGFADHILGISDHMTSLEVYHSSVHSMKADIDSM